MKSKNWVVPLVCLLIAALPAFAKKKDPSEVEWSEKIPQAIGEAGSSGRPVLVDIWAVWCAPCKEMDETTYKDPDVLQGIEDFVPLKVDADLQEVFIEKYDIDAYPTILFLDGEGAEITRLLGSVTAPDLLLYMDKVRSGYSDYLEAKGKKGDPVATEVMASYLMDIGNSKGAADILKRSLKQLKNADPVQREQVEILFAEALLTSGEDKQASKSFERLATEAQADEIRGRALAGLVQINRRRGHEEEADAVLEQLRAQHPDLAEKLQ